MRSSPESQFDSLKEVASMLMRAIALTFVTDIADVVRMRTGECGPGAIQRRRQA